MFLSHIDNPVAQEAHPCLFAGQQVQLQAEFLRRSRIQQVAGNVPELETFVLQCDDRGLRTIQLQTRLNQPDWVLIHSIPACR